MTNAPPHPKGSEALDASEEHDRFDTPILQMDLRCLHCGTQERVRVTKRADGTVFAACSDCLRVCAYCAAQFPEPRR